MNKKVIAEIKKELLIKKTEIEKELKGVTESGKQAKGARKIAFMDLGDANDDNAKEVDIYSTNLSVASVLESNLKDINKALQSIKAGKYGICKYCGKEISEKRLKARPVSSACVACKSKLQSSR